MRYLLLGLALGAIACAPLGSAPEAPLAPMDEVALHQDVRLPADIDAAFRGEIATRYSVDAGVETVSNDLARSGFICRPEGVYPQVRPGGVLKVCELPKPHGLCSDMWTVDLKLKQVTGQIAVQRVTPEGRFTRTCVSGASPNG